MDTDEKSMRSDVSFRRILYSQSRESLTPRLGKFIVKKPNGAEIRVDTPGLITSTSRGVIPHLTKDHVGKTDAIKWVHVPFETFLERNPPITDLVGGSKPLQTLIGLQDDTRVVSMSLRDPHDVREMPPNGNKFVNANCIRGVRKVTPEQYRSFVQSCDPDIAFALTDIPFTPSPFSQKRITKSIERSSTWLSSLLHSSSEILADRHHPFNVFVHMAGDISESARRAFTNSLLETLYGKEAEQVKPFKRLDDAVLGYSFDLVPLRTSILAKDKPIVEEDEQKTPIPNRRGIDTKPLTNPLSEEVIPHSIGLIRASLDSLPSSKPRLVTGASSPHEILYLIRDVGIDLFDVAWAQKAADWGIALDFVFPVPQDPNGVQTGNGIVRVDGKRDLGHNLYSSQYVRDFSRLSNVFLDGATSQTDPDIPNDVCPCIACSPTSSPTELTHASIDVLTRTSRSSIDETPAQTYDPPFTRAYLHHLLHTHEMSAHALLAAHNLSIAHHFFASVRTLLSSGASHIHHPHSHPHTHAQGLFHADTHPETEVLVHPDSDAHFSVFEQEVDRFCLTYDGALRIFGEAKRDWVAVDYARGKGRLAREKAKKGEADLATKTEKEADVDEVSAEV